MLRRGPELQSEVPRDKKRGQDCVREVIPLKPCHYGAQGPDGALFHMTPSHTDLLRLSGGGAPCSSDHIDNSTPHPLTVGNHKLSEADAEYLVDILHLHRCHAQSNYDRLLFLLTLVAVVDKRPEKHLSSATLKFILYASPWNSVNFMTNQLILWWDLTWWQALRRTIRTLQSHSSYGWYVCFCQSYRGCSIKLRLFHNQIKVPCATFKSLYLLQ